MVNLPIQPQFWTMGTRYFRLKKPQDRIRLCWTRDCRFGTSIGNYIDITIDTNDVTDNYKMEYIDTNGVTNLLKTGTGVALSTTSSYHNTPTSVDLWTSFDGPQFATCPSDELMIGIYRNSCANLHCIEEFKCAKPNGFSYSLSCIDYPISPVSQGDFNWIQCPNNNEFLNGIERNSIDTLQGITRIRCCTFTNTDKIITISDEKINDWWQSMDTEGLSSVDINYFMTGLNRNAGPGGCDINHLYLGCLEEAKSRKITYSTTLSSTTFWVSHNFIDSTNGYESSIAFGEGEQIGTFEILQYPDPDTPTQNIIQLPRSDTFRYIYWLGCYDICTTCLNICNETNVNHNDLVGWYIGKNYFNSFTDSSLSYWYDMSYKGNHIESKCITSPDTITHPNDNNGYTYLQGSHINKIQLGGCQGQDINLLPPVYTLFTLARRGSGTPGTNQIQSTSLYVQNEFLGCQPGENVYWLFTASYGYKAHVGSYTTTQCRDACNNLLDGIPSCDAWLIRAPHYCYNYWNIGANNLKFTCGSVVNGGGSFYGEIKSIITSSLSTTTITPVLGGNSATFVNNIVTKIVEHSNSNVNGAIFQNFDSILNSGTTLFYSGYGATGGLPEGYHYPTLITNENEPVIDPITDAVLTPSNNDWALFTDQRSMLRSQGVDITNNYVTDFNLYDKFGINNDGTTGFDILEILIYQVELSIDQICCVEQYIANKYTNSFNANLPPCCVPVLEEAVTWPVDFEVYKIGIGSGTTTTSIPLGSSCMCTDTQTCDEVDWVVYKNGLMYAWAATGTEALGWDIEKIIWISITNINRIV